MDNLKRAARAYALLQYLYAGRGWRDVYDLYVTHAEAHGCPIYDPLVLLRAVHEHGAAVVRAVDDALVVELCEEHVPFFVRCTRAPNKGFEWAYTIWLDRVAEIVGRDTKVNK